MPDTTTLSLLLATDDLSLASRIEGAGLRVITTRDAFDAIRIAVETKPDAIILGDTLNGLPGPTIALWLKLNPATSAIPVIGLDTSNPVKWAEAQLDACIPSGQAEVLIEEIARDLKNIKAKREDVDPGVSRKYHDPMSVALDIIEVYRERLSLSGTMMEIATIQHDLADFEHTIRLIMDAAARALKSHLLALTILHDDAQYVLVRGPGLSLRHLQTLENENIRMLEAHLGNSVSIQQQLVFGRRRLSVECVETLASCRLFGYPVTCKGETLGYLTGLCPSQETISGWSSGLLPDLASQVALLLNNAELLREQEQHLSELASILRAALETSSISPLSGTHKDNSLLQYLLIVLELCHTDTGCVVLFDEATGSFAETAALGCNPHETLSEPFKDGMTVTDCILSMKPEELVIDSDPDAGPRNGRLLVPLAVGEKVMGGMVILGITGVPNFRIIQAVRTLAGMGGYFIYNSALYKQTVKTSILEEQLNIAREIQRDMIPASHPDIPGFDIFGRSEPARQVGGDFFDYLHLDDGRLQIAIADVSGKGIPASLLMTMTRALVIAASEKTDGPEQVLADVNSHLVSRISSGQFVTASLLTVGEGEINYASAGHSPLLIYRAATGEFEDIAPDGVAMGIVQTLDFERVVLKLNPGDVCLLYTDGLNEAMNHQKEQFGYERIREVVRQHAEGTAESIVEALFQAIADHAAEADLFDDTTVVAVKKLSEEEYSNAGIEDQKQENKGIDNKEDNDTEAKPENIRDKALPPCRDRAGSAGYRFDNPVRSAGQDTGGVPAGISGADRRSSRRNRLWDRRSDSC